MLAATAGERPRVTTRAAPPRVNRPGSPPPQPVTGDPGGHGDDPDPSTDSPLKATLEGLLMSRTPTPVPAEDAREQARRALQTSMDTRQ